MQPRFLADESCDFRVVRALRAEGYDVDAILELARGATDQAVIQRAVEQNRVLLTEDTDFGQLVYAESHASTGVVLIRFPAGARAGLPTQLLELVHREGHHLVGSFVVLQPGRTRISRRPQS